jgi:hypothetical protein
MVERNAGTPVDRRQTFRIGLHLGDIIVSDDDVFGDTVNVASRLEGLAEPGSIVLSASVYEQVRDKLALPFRSQGSRALKNIDRPIPVYSLDAGWRQAAKDEGPRASPDGRWRRHRVGAGHRRRARLRRRSRAFGQCRGGDASASRERAFCRRPDVHQPER